MTPAPRLAAAIRGRRSGIRLLWPPNGAAPGHKFKIQQGHLIFALTPVCQRVPCRGTSVQAWSRGREPPGAPPPPERPHRKKQKQSLGRGKTGYFNRVHDWQAALTWACQWSGGKANGPLASPALAACVGGRRARHPTPKGGDRATYRRPGFTPAEQGHRDHTGVTMVGDAAS